MNEPRNQEGGGRLIINRHDLPIKFVGSVFEWNKEIRIKKL